MRYLLSLCFFGVLACCLSAQTPAIIPQPVEIKNLSGAFSLLPSTSIGAGSAVSKAVAEEFVRRIEKSSGYRPRIGNSGQVVFTINSREDNRLGKEGYTLEVNPKLVRVTANDAAGLFYGMQTLLQLLPPEIESKTLVRRKSWTIPAVQITDYPRFGWRGLMLDVSRHFFSKEDVKAYIDRMARYKYNVFHWHLTDDNGWRIEIKSRPLLTQVGACRVQRYGKFGGHAAPQANEPATDCGFYTQEDIREIIAYAAERHISILPEIDVPGHSMAALAAYPELSCSRDKNIRVSPGHNFAEWYDNGTFKMLQDNTLNPSDEKVYAFMDDVLTEVAALFPYPYIHIGGDECYHGYWEKDADCQALMTKLGITNMVQLQSYFISRVEKIVRSKGKKLIGWDEILEGGLVPGATVMSWRGIKGAVEAAHLGHEVVMTSNDHLYIDLLQGEELAEPDATRYKRVPLKKMYDFDPVPDGVDAKYILGGQANLWTEKIPTLRHAEYMTWPRGWAAAELFWSPKSVKNWDAFVNRMEHHFERSDAGDFNYARSAYDVLVKPTVKDGKLAVEMTTEVNGLDIYYTTDETTPDLHATRYTRPVVIPEGNSVTLRVVTYKNGKPAGRVINFPAEVLRKRAK
jgi:hexosaminidase